MAVLQPGSMVFYHPLDSLTDSAGSLWTDELTGGNGVSFPAGGKVGSYMVNTGPGAGQIVNSAYPGVGAVSRFTLAAWAKIDAGDIYVGHLNLPTTTYQIIQPFADGSVRVFYGSGMSSFMWPAGTVPVAVGWHLYVLDMERSGTDWILRHSADGAAFTTESPFAGGAFTGSPAYGVVGTRTSVDEVVLWRDLAAPFTSDELANLFDLADTFGEGMDQYSQNFVAPICWQATARMPDGSVWRDSGSGPCPPVVRVPRGAEDIVVTDDGAPASPRIAEG